MRNRERKGWQETKGGKEKGNYEIKGGKEGVYPKKCLPSARTIGHFPSISDRALGKHYGAISFHQMLWRRTHVHHFAESGLFRRVPCGDIRPTYKLQLSRGWQNTRHTNLVAECHVLLDIFWLHSAYVLCCQVPVRWPLVNYAFSGSVYAGIYVCSISWRG